MAFLHLQEWEKAKLDLTDAEDMQENFINNNFGKEYDSFTDFGQKHHVKLPEDIATLLTSPQV